MKPPLSPSRRDWKRKRLNVKDSKLKKKYARRDWKLMKHKDSSLKLKRRLRDLRLQRLLRSLESRNKMQKKSV